MANRRIQAFVTTHIIGVGIKTLYMAAPRPTNLSAEGERRLETDMVLARSGGVLRVVWQMDAGAVSYDLEVHRVRMSDTGTEIVSSATVTAPLFNWTPTKAGIYFVRVRANIDGRLTAWVQSNDPVITANGASRGWLLQVYLAPVSGGGIR